MSDELYEARKANYEDKKEDKIRKYKTRAKKAFEESERREKAAHDAVSGIPMGQPILVGHHSEKIHRNTLKKHDTNMQKSIEEQNKADYYIQKANATENNTSISSDDPDAVKKLKEKIDTLKKESDYMKRANKEFKKLQKDKDYKLDLTEEEKKRLAETVKENARLFPYYDRPYPDFKLTNINAKIRAAEKRITKIENVFSVNTKNKKYTIDGLLGITFEKDVIENRFKVYPPAKEESFKMGLPTIFKKMGFKWSPTNKCYQHFLTSMTGWKESALIEALKNAFKK